MIIKYIATYRDGTKVTLCGKFNSFEHFDKFEVHERQRPNYKDESFTVVEIQNA